MTLEQLSAAATEGKLLPCPFCGREARIVERVTGPNGPGFFCAVSCYCGGYSAKAHQSATSNNDQMARVEAITRWNQRTGQLVAVQPVDRVVVGTVTSPSCMACEGTPKEGNNPCAVCGRRAQPDYATVERVKDAIGTSLAYDIGMDVRAGSLTDDEKRKLARKAIRAMKGPKL